MGAVRGAVRGDDAGQLREPRQERPDAPVARGLVGVQPGQLRPGERGLHRGELLVAREHARDVVAVPARAQVLAELPVQHDALVEFLVVGGDQAALTAGGQVLDHVEADRVDVAEGGDRAAPVPRALRLGGVLHEVQPVLVGERAQCREVSGQPVQVDRDDRAGARGDRGLGRGRINGVGDRVDVDEDRHEQPPHHRDGRADERQRGYQDLGAGFQAERGQGQLQGGGAVGHRRAEPDAGVGGPVALQPGHRAAAAVVGGVQPGVEDPEHGLALGLGDHRPAGALPGVLGPGHLAPAAEHGELVRHGRPPLPRAPGRPGTPSG